MQIRSPLLTLLVAVAAGACAPAEADDLTSVGRVVTCAMWSATTDSERLTIADRVVDSPELLERIRMAQRQPDGTPREALILDVVGSVTKGCDVWAPPDEPVTEVVAGIYSR